MNSIQTILSLRQKPNVWDGESFSHAEYKLDGVRMTIIVEEDGAIFCIGRKAYINLWPQLQRQENIAPLIRGLCPGTVIDGELYSPSIGGGTSSDVTSLLVTGKGLVFCPWNISWFNKASWSLVSVRSQRARLKDLGFIPPPLITRENFEKVIKRANEDNVGLRSVCEELGIEGFVLKADPFYCWWKLKPMRSVDCIVTGWEEGKSRNQGRLGALRIAVVAQCGAYRCLGNVGTGFSDQQRNEIGPDCVGKVVEIAYDCIAAQGKLRFPRFIRFRDDKPIEECDGREL